MAGISQKIPLTPSCERVASWTGRSFLIDGVEQHVLRFPVGQSGWNERLTSLHEAEAGEGAHYIDVASRRHALAEILRVTRGDRAPTVLEIGVSSGYMLRDIKFAIPDVRLLGADYVGGRLDQLAEAFPDTCFLQFDLTDCPLPDNFLDVVVALNVLEHIENDNGAAEQIARVLVPGGRAIIEVPAGPELYDSYDRELMHFRRYRMPELVRVLTAAGLRIETQSHLGFFLYPAFWIAKKLSRAQSMQRTSAETRSNAVSAGIGLSTAFGAAGHMLMTAEAFFRQRIPMPFGIRCLITARKPKL